MAKKRQTNGVSKNYKMSSEEIAAARKKLEELSKAEILNKKLECSKCKNPATSLCPYCKEYFCDEHINPTMSMPHPSRWPQNDPQILVLYKEEWVKKNSHVCVPYTTKKLEEIETRKNPRVVSWKHSAGYPNTSQLYTTPRQKVAEEVGKIFQMPYEQLNKSSTNKANTTRQSESRSWILRLFYSFWMLKEAFILAIVVAILATLHFNLISLGHSTYSISILSTTSFLLNFMVLLIITAIYGKVTTRRARGWHAFSIAVIVSVVLITEISFTAVASVSRFVILFTLNSYLILTIS